jgi:hypothetical protein
VLASLEKYVNYCSQSCGCIDDLGTPPLQLREKWRITMLDERMNDTYTAATGFSYALQNKDSTMHASSLPQTDARTDEEEDPLLTLNKRELPAREMEFFNAIAG